MVFQCFCDLTLLDRLGAVLERLGGILGRLGASLARLGAILGRLSAILKPLGAILGRLGRVLASQNPPKIAPRPFQDELQLSSKLRSNLEPNLGRIKKPKPFKNQ